jgi:hypothetical protein
MFSGKFQIKTQYSTKHGFPKLTFNAAIQSQEIFQLILATHAIDADIVLTISGKAMPISLPNTELQGYIRDELIIEFWGETIFYREPSNHHTITVEQATDISAVVGAELRQFILQCLIEACNCKDPNFSLTTHDYFFLHMGTTALKNLFTISQIRVEELPLNLQRILIPRLL